jgi:hypothetical protein
MSSNEYDIGVIGGGSAVLVQRSPLAMPGLSMSMWSHLTKKLFPLTNG